MLLEIRHPKNTKERERERENYQQDEIKMTVYLRCFVSCKTEIKNTLGGGGVSNPQEEISLSPALTIPV